MLLDDEFPCIPWTLDIQKNGKRAEIVLHPELARLLRMHRENVPNGADDKVFPIVPPRNTFREDRDRAGVSSVDSRGRRFSPHSARKWFKTTLASSSVPDSMTEFLMRHSGLPEARYMDPPTNAQPSALMKLSSIWPENLNNDVDPDHTTAETMGMGRRDSEWSHVDPDIESSDHPASSFTGPQDSTTSFLTGNAEGRTRTADLSVMNAPL